MADPSTKSSTEKSAAEASGEGKREKSSKRRQVLPSSLNPWAKKGLIPWAKKQFPNLRGEFQHLADRMWNIAEDELFSGDMRPPVDISETEKSIVIAMDLPGFDPDEIDIEINENMITIRSQRQAGCCVDDDTHIFHRTERPCGSFTRTFTLPCEVAGAETAKCADGVLTITIPKSKNAYTRKIKVTGQQ